MKSDNHTVRYFTEDNFEITGVLSVPNKKSPSPVIIFAHGFCGDKDENGFFIKAAEHFANRGFASLRFDFRGCGDSQGDFQRVRLKDNLLDIKATIDFIETTNFNIDSTHVGFIGFSLGATVALLSNLVSLQNIKALAFWAPAFFPNQDMYPRYDNELVRNEIKEKGYLEKANLKVSNDFLIDLSNCDTTSQLNTFNKPVIIIHGSEDNKINPNSSRIGFECINRNGIKNAFEIIEGASHSFKESDELRRHVIELTEIWFDNFLINEMEEKSFINSLQKFSFLDSFRLLHHLSKRVNIFTF